MPFFLYVYIFSEKPGPPRNLVRQKVFYDKSKTPYLTITWEAPIYDGGAAVTNYVVEYKTVKTEWSTANISTVHVTEFSFPAHVSETYTVRVRAVNSLGEGNPSNFIFAKLTGKFYLFKLFKTLFSLKSQRCSDSLCTCSIPPSMPESLVRTCFS